MSKLKTPQDKKRASLARDRRNAYGESPHGARKSIPRNKALSRQAARRISRSRPWRRMRNKAELGPPMQQPLC